MAVVRFRKRWQARVRDYNGQVWSIVCDTKDEAQRIEAEMRACRRAGQSWVHPRDRQAVQVAKLRDLAEVFMRAQMSRLARRTLIRYAAELEAFVSWAEEQGRGAVADLSRALLRTWWQAYAERTGSRPQTINKVVGTVEVFWRWLDEHDDEHPCDVPKPRRLEMPRTFLPPVIAPTWGEMDDALSELDRVEWARRAGWILRFSGARIGEVLALSWDDVDIEAGWLMIRPEVAKGGYSSRLVPLSRFLTAELRRWTRDDDRLIGPVHADIHNTSRPARVFETAWRRAGVREGAWKRQATRAFRKGVQSGLLALGAHPDAVKLLVGHSMGEARRHYIDPEIAIPLRKVVDMIPAVGVSDA